MKIEIRSLIWACTLLCFSFSSPALSEPNLNLNFQSANSVAFSLSVRDGSGNEVYSSQAALDNHSFDVDNDVPNRPFEELFLNFSFENGSPIGNLKMLVDLQRSAPITINLKIFNESNPTLAELLRITRSAENDPLSAYLYSQFLESNGVADLGKNHEVTVAYLEYKALYNLTCIKPNLFFFDEPEEYPRTLNIVPVLGKLDENNNEEYDRLYKRAWDRLRISQSNVASDIKKIPLCDWKRYALVRQASKKKDVERAFHLVQYFKYAWDQLSSSEQSIVLEIAKVDSSVIDKDYPFLRTKAGVQR